MTQAKKDKNNSPPAFLTEYQTKIVPSQRWVRVKFGGEWVADTRQALLLLQYKKGQLPAYFFPRRDVRQDVLRATAKENGQEGAVYWTVKAGDKEAVAAAWSFVKPPAEVAALKDFITFRWHKMDAWYEEEEEIFVHPRDPYKRVDSITSSRHVRVEVDGQTVADTRRPVLLFETGLPVRYYIPPADIEMAYLEPARGTTQCPYKGVASYWSVRVDDAIHRNIVWSYPEPIPESPKIMGLLCFFNEKVDIYVDGELQARPQTPWS